jgi:hypothetical protein
MGLTRDHSLSLPLIVGHNGTLPRFDHSLSLSPPLSLRVVCNGASSRIDHSLAAVSPILAFDSSPIKLDCLGLAKVEADLVCGV